MSSSVIKKDSLPTVAQINSDSITLLANKHWAPGVNKKIGDESVAENKDVINSVYNDEIVGSEFSVRRIMVLEFSQYLENCLWPLYRETSTHAHMMSIVIMVNEKFRERVLAWEPFKSKPEYFPAFFKQVLNSVLDENVPLREKTSLLVFLIHCFNSCEVEIIRDNIKKLVSLAVWNSILPERRDQEFKKCPLLVKYWNKMKKKDNDLNPSELDAINFERRFLYQLIQNFFTILDTIPSQEKSPELNKEILESVHYCERFVELMIDLEALPLTRRFCNVLLDDSHVVVKCQLSMLSKRLEGRLFTQLLEILKFYSRFEVNEFTGEPLSDNDMMLIHYALFTNVQRAAFKKFPDLKQFYLTNVASVDTRDTLEKVFSSLDNPTLHEIAAFVKLLPKISDVPKPFDNQFLLELLISKLEKRDSQ